MVNSEVAGKQNESYLPYFTGLLNSPTVPGFPCPPYSPGFLQDFAGAPLSPGFFMLFFMRMVLMYMYRDYAKHGREWPN